VVDTRAPSTNGDNGHGRDRRGRFAAGNPGGPGNPHARTAAAWRWELFEAVTPADVRAVVRTLVRRAKASEPWAVREILDRCLGRPGQANERTEPLNGQPPVDLKVDLGDIETHLRESLKRAALQPLVPGLPLL